MIIAITGGLGALGLVMGEEMVKRGHEVILIGRSMSRQINLPGAHVMADVDLSDLDTASQSFSEIQTKFKALNGLVNLAGGFDMAPLESRNIDIWDRLYNLNLRTAVTACTAALPLLLESKGHIVNVSAFATLEVKAGMGAYTASKSGVTRLTEALSDECRDRGVTVNCVLPSIIDTPANRASMPEADFSRWVSPSSLTRVISFLLSEDARDINGAAIPVRGRC